MDGGVLSTTDGVVAWTPVRSLQANLLEQILRGYAKVQLRLWLGATLRLQAHDDWCNCRALAHTSPEAAYIHSVGVEPSLAGQGLGSALMNAAFSRIGQSYGRCTLRTEKLKHRRFYEKLSFRGIEKARVPATGLAAWFFVREV